MLHRNITLRARVYIERSRPVRSPALLGTQSSTDRHDGVCIARSKSVNFFSGLWVQPAVAAAHTATCVPTSTTRPVGMWKKSVASLADLAKPMNSRSCQRGMAECEAGLRARRDRKNDVDMISKCQPCLRATASAFGTFGDSM